MSWFDATGLANIAKTALKEAQKTIDKALDIRDEDEETENVKAKPKSSSPEKNKPGGLNDKKNHSSQDLGDNEMKQELHKNSEMPSSNWGSFSGSFFQLDSAKNLISTQPLKFSLSLSDKPVIAPLATPETELTPVDSSGQNILKGEENCKGDNAVLPTLNVITKSIDKNDEEKKGVSGVEAQDKLVVETGSIDDKVITRPKTRRNSANRNSLLSNRLSILSTESEGRKSSDSVEILGSVSCTTSPDTDLPSISASSSLGLPVSSSCTDSVEVIDSLASPSSVEILKEGSGSGSGRTTQSSSTNSPKDENVNQNLKLQKFVSSPISNLTDASPESFEVIPDLPEYDEELSVADSYTSVSESTGATVLEPSHSCSNHMTESYTDISQTSSKFQSGDSTPDVISKFPVISKNLYDILPESINVPDFDTMDCTQPKSSEWKKSLFEYVKSSQKPPVNEDSFKVAFESLIRKSQPSEENPTKKLMLKSCDRGYWLKSDDMKFQKSDLSKSETIKPFASKKEMEDIESSVLGSDRSDTFSSEEISGSMSSFSDSRTIVANDSSCDEVALESSSEDVGTASGFHSNNTFRTVEKLETDGSQNHAYYVKNLLSEAMKEMSTRETSPTLSEKSRSDLVKVGSEQTSGHTSGDELETTTSSDIEIISRYSPNGDSSSTASRHSPAKLLHLNSKSKLSLVAVDILGRATHSKIKGHQREPSETSSFCSEDNPSEIEKLTKRIAELTEILEARESRLNDLRKNNLEIQEKNQELKKDLELAKKEVTSGLYALQSESEKDILIKELKEEGEKLSKKELKQATLIKTLRAQEKAQQAVIENNKAQLEKLMKTNEDLKTELSIKKESEKNLSVNVKQMNKKITRQDEEIANLMNQMERAVVKAEELKILLDSREEELAKCKELLATEDYRLQDAQSNAELKSKQLERLQNFQENAVIELEDLRQQLKKVEEVHSEREKFNKEEKNELMRRLQEAEGRNEELTQSVSKATRPLLRQMEALQATTAHERETWEKQERNLLQKLEEAESRLSSVSYVEKSLKQETLELRGKLSNVEQLLQASNQELFTWKSQVEALTKQLEENKRQSESEKLEFDKQQMMLRIQINELKDEVSTLENQLLLEKANTEIEKKKIVTMQDQLKEKDIHSGNRDSNSPRSSPTLSFGRVSLCESLSSNAWPQFGEEGFEASSTSGRYYNVYDNLRAGNTTSLIESLQAQLKMRDGETSQLQWELQKRDTERLALTTELSTLTSRLDEKETKLAQAEAAEKNLKELQTNYDALLEMYGEKVEEVEELRLDLQDVKEMYKSQIDQLLKKEKQDSPL